VSDSGVDLEIDEKYPASHRNSDSRPAEVKAGKEKVPQEAAGEKDQAATTQPPSTPRPVLVLVLAAPSRFLASLIPANSAIRPPTTVSPPTSSSSLRSRLAPRQLGRVRKVASTSDRQSRRSSKRIASQVASSIVASEKVGNRRRSKRIPSRVASAILTSETVGNQAADQSDSGSATEISASPQ
jgi:hypothetical protein